MTRRIKLVNDIPKDDFRKEDSVGGLVINEIASLTRDEKEFILDFFPDIHFSKMLILEEVRTPVSEGASVGAITEGGCCCSVAAIGGLCGLGLILWAGLRGGGAEQNTNADSAHGKRRKRQF